MKAAIFSYPQGIATCVKKKNFIIVALKNEKKMSSTFKKMISELFTFKLK